MEITTKLLSDLGADPKIYSAEERIRMGEYADKVIGGELSAIVNAIKFPTDDFNSAKKMYGDRLASLMDTVSSISAEADKLADLLSHKNSIFTSEISESEKSSVCIIYPSESYISHIRSASKSPFFIPEGSFVR